MHLFINIFLIIVNKYILLHLQIKITYFISKKNFNYE